MISTTSIPSLIDPSYGPSTQRRKESKHDSTDKWINTSIKRPGQLHKDLHVPNGQKIPSKKLQKAEHSKNPKIRQRAVEAETVKSFHRK